MTNEELVRSTLHDVVAEKNPYGYYVVKGWMERRWDYAGMYHAKATYQHYITGTSGPKGKTMEDAWAHAAKQLQEYFVRLLSE